MKSTKSGPGESRIGCSISTHCGHYALTARIPRLGLAVGRGGPVNRGKIMDKKWAAMAVFVALGACTQPAANSNAAGDNAAAPATAAAIPNLLGTWVGTGESIVTGMALHHAAQTGPEPLRDNVQFTYNITGQDGHRFWGTVKSAQGEERITGVVTQDGKSIVAQDNDGEIRGSITGPDTIDFVYNHGGSSTVVALNTITRQK